MFQKAVCNGKPQLDARMLAREALRLLLELPENPRQELRPDASTGVLHLDRVPPARRVRPEGRALGMPDGSRTVPPSRGNLPNRSFVRHDASPSLSKYRRRPLAAYRVVRALLRVRPGAAASFDILLSSRPRAVTVPSSPVSPSDIERLVGLPVHDVTLYEQALTHRSRFRGQADNHLATNERLEFLGDALLGFVMAEALYRRFPNKNEGYLTRLRAKLVSGKALARYARRIDLGPHLLMSENAARSEGRNNPSILADAYEALVGAVYLDHDLDAARRFIQASALGPVDLSAIAAQNENYKSQLLEYAQARGRPQPTYRVVLAEGPSHDRTFTVEALLDDTPYGQGTASSKKKAEQLAAAEALDALRENDAEPLGDERAGR